MAYAKINQLLQGNEDAQKTNIFAPSQVSAGGEDIDQIGAPQQEAKTSTDGAVQGQGQQQRATAAQQSSDTQQNRASRELVRRNLGKQQAPTTLDDIGQRLSGARQNLEQEGQSYLQEERKQAEQKYGKDAVGPEASNQMAARIGEEAIGGGQALSQLRQSAPTPGEFQPETNLNVATDLSRSLRGGDVGPSRPVDEVVRGYLRQEQGPMYNKAESDLDLQLLRARPDYMPTLRGLAGQQEELQQRSDTMGGELQQQAAVYEDQLRQSVLDDVLNYLTAQRGGLEEQNRAELASFQQSQEPLSLENQLAGLELSPEQQIAMESGAVDPASFYQAANLQGLGYQDFIDQAEADRYNKIQELLGVGGSALGVGGMGAGREASFNADAYLQALDDAYLASMPLIESPEPEVLAPVSYSDIVGDTSPIDITGDRYKSPQELAAMQIEQQIGQPVAAPTYEPTQAELDAGAAAVNALNVPMGSQGFTPPEPPPQNVEGPVGESLYATNPYVSLQYLLGGYGA